MDTRPGPELSAPPGSVVGMRFPDNFLDEIRARLPVSEVVGRRVKLKKQGREWRGLSPFQAEKTPSFYVNDQKGFYHDFSSTKHGDIFTFLMETEGLTFPEAVERLAGEAGIPMPKTSREMDERELRRKTLYEVMDLATAFFRQQLALQVGARARGYLESRGVSAATQEEFQIGYAPNDRSLLKQYLGSKGVPVSDMIEAGLLVAGEEIPVPYDRFRDRIIFPIHDPRGRVVAFGGRALTPDAQPKYLNSPETTLFHKGSIVFNFHRARSAAHDDGSVVVVEGYMDAISIYQGGLKSVVATMGTSFTEPQVETLWRLSAEPIVCFDGDKAGIAAAYRSVDRILPILRVGRTFRFAFIHGGQDPDELVREKGIDAFRPFLQGALPLWDVLWERETRGAEGPQSPDAFAAFEHKMYSIIRTIKDPAVNSAYYRTCRVELSEFFWQRTREKRESARTPKTGLVQREIKIEKEGHRHGLQQLVLGMLVHYPEFIDEKSDGVTTIHFSGQLEDFRQALYDLLVMYKDVDVALIYTRLKGDYYEVLQTVHGDRSGKLERGHRLFAKFPILKAAPPIDFVSRCLDHFVHILRIEQMADDLVRLTAEMTNEGQDSDALSDHVTHLVRDIQLQRETVNHTDQELADEAKEIRWMGQQGGHLPPNQLAA
jgi:DNA primase